MLTAVDYCDPRSLGFQSKGSSDVRNASYIHLALVCGVLLAVSGCKPKIEEPKVDSENFQDSRYYQSLRGLGSQTQFENFLAGLDPANKVKYINKSLEEGPAQVYALKPVYEKFVNDPSPEVAAAAKEAVSKAPSKEEFEASQKEELEKLKTK